MPKLKTASAEPKTAGDLRMSNSRAQLFGFVERLERLDEERGGLVDDMKEVRGEAKAMGYDTKILGQLLRRRKMDKGERIEGDAMLEMYEEAVEAHEAQQFKQSVADGGEPGEDE